MWLACCFVFFYRPDTDAEMYMEILINSCKLIEMVLLSVVTYLAATAMGPKDCMVVLVPCLVTKDNVALHFTQILQCKRWKIPS